MDHLVADVDDVVLVGGMVATDRHRCMVLLSANVAS
jgi:hypothetical protein